jgi:hypothetical protein
MIRRVRLANSHAKQLHGPIGPALSAACEEAQRKLGRSAGQSAERGVGRELSIGSDPIFRFARGQDDQSAEFFWLYFSV